MVSTSPFAQLPIALLESEVSHGAARAYAILSLLPRQNENKIWISQHYVADQLKCTTRQLRNYLKELLSLGFLENTNELHGANKVYKLLGCHQTSKSNQNTSQLPKGTTQTAESKLELSGKGGNGFPPIELNLNSNSISNSNCRKSSSKPVELIRQHGNSWSKEFSCFDGKESRATLLQKVEEAVKRFQYGDLVSYVRYYLSQGAKWLIQATAKLYGVIAEKPIESLAELKQARKEAEQKRKDYANRFMPKETIEVHEADQAFIRESFAKLRSRIGFKRSEI